MKSKRIFNLISILLFSFLPLSSCSNSTSDNKENIEDKENDNKEDSNDNEDKKEDDTPQVCEHEFEISVQKEGNCISKEVDLYTCKKCKYSYLESGNYGDHILKEEYIRKVLDNSICNTFTKITKCELCDTKIYEEEVKYKDHHYILLKDTGKKAIYKCICCNDILEYVFNLNDFNYSVNVDKTYNFTYKGKDKNVYIPSNIKIAKLSINNNYIERLKLESNIDDSVISQYVINNCSKLKYLDLKDTNIETLELRFICNDFTNLEEIIFPDKLLALDSRWSNINKLSYLDLSNTNLEYTMFYETKLPKKLYLPSTIKQWYFDNDPIYTKNLKEIIVESEDILGSLYSNNLITGEYRLWYTDRIKYNKEEEYNVNVNLIYPNGENKTLKLPYGCNLFKNEEYLKLLENDGNKKIGWYKEKTCFDYFFGIVPKKDITLYGMYLDEMDETFLNKHQFLYEPEYYFKNNSIKIYKINELTELPSILYYMLSNDKFKCNVDISSLNNFYVDSIIMYTSFANNDFYYMFGWNGISYNDCRLISQNGYITITLDDHETIVKKYYDLDNVVYNSKFDYTASFKDFDYGNNNRSDDFEDFKYQSYKDVKEGVTNPTIMNYMMSVGIKVIPKENSIADKTLKIYKNIARHIFNDKMSDYEKLVACNKYYSNYIPIGDKNAAYNLNNNGLFSGLIEELPYHGTINCNSQLAVCRMLYDLEGIQMFGQVIPNHVYGVIKFNNKWYVSDHMQLYGWYKEGSYEVPLRGYLDFNVKDNEVLEDDDYIIKAFYHNTSYAYPGIELEKYHL